MINPTRLLLSGVIGAVSIIASCSDSGDRTPFSPAVVGSDVAPSNEYEGVRILGGTIASSEIRLQYLFNDRTMDIYFSVALRSHQTPLSTIQVTALPAPARAGEVNEVVLGGLSPDSDYRVRFTALRQGDTTFNGVIDSLRTRP